jgi:hypothetical protein
MKVFRGFFLRICDSGGRGLVILVVSGVGNMKIFRGLFLRISDSGGRGLVILVVSGQHEDFSGIISSDF